MATIHIKDVGPLKDTGIINLTRITLLLGPQGAGKSTLMKILCYCRWIEKEIMLDARKANHYTRYKRFIKLLMKFHRLSSDFFSSDSAITYIGENIELYWQGIDSQNVRIEPILEPPHNPKESILKTPHNPKISFIPAERNLVSAVSNIDKSYRSNPWEDSLFNFILELEEARNLYNRKEPLPLSIDGQLEYFYASGQHMIKMKHLERSLSAYYASSGIQSAFPIDVITSYLSNSIGKMPKITANEALRLLFSEKSEREDAERLSAIKSRYTYSSMQLYIEEPEQNLYPEAQRLLLLNLLDLLLDVKEKETHPSSLFITTHSPYLLSVINTQIALVRAYNFLEDIENEEERRKRKEALDAFVGKQGRYLKESDYSAYFIENGELRNLIDPEYPMVSGLDLDSVSDWVDEYTEQVYDIIYSKYSEQ